jgi:hypothetical protein
MAGRITSGLATTWRRGGKEGASRPHRDLLTVSAPMRRVSGNVSGGVTGIPRASALTG